MRSTVRASGGRLLPVLSCDARNLILQLASSIQSRFALAISLFIASQLKTTLPAEQVYRCISCFSAVQNYLFFCLKTHCNIIIAVWPRMRFCSSCNLREEEGEGADSKSSLICVCVWAQNFTRREHFHGWIPYEEKPKITSSNRPRLSPTYFLQKKTLLYGPLVN